VVECPPRPTHVPLLRKVDSTDRLVAWRHFARILGSNVLHLARKDPQDSCHLHRSDCTTTLICAHTTSRIVLPCDVRLGSLTVAMPEAGDFVELLEPCRHWPTFVILGSSSCSPLALSHSPASSKASWVSPPPPCPTGDPSSMPFLHSRCFTQGKVPPVCCRVCRRCAGYQTPVFQPISQSPCAC